MKKKKLEYGDEAKTGFPETIPPPPKIIAPKNPQPRPTGQQLFTVELHDDGIMTEQPVDNMVVLGETNDNGTDIFTQN